jgi:hypothetical protein
MRSFLEDELHECQRWRGILEIRLHVVNLVRWGPVEPLLELRLDMLRAGGDTMISHHLMNTARCPIRKGVCFVLHQQHDAMGLCQVTQFSVAKIPNPRILAVVATCPLRKE